MSISRVCGCFGNFDGSCQFLVQSFGGRGFRLLLFSSVEAF